MNTNTHSTQNHYLLHIQVGPKNFKFTDIESYYQATKVLISPLMNDPVKVMEMIDRYQRHNDLNGNKFMYAQLITTNHEYASDIWRSIYENRGYSFIEKPYKFYDKVSPFVKVETLIIDDVYIKFKSTKAKQKRAAIEWKSASGPTNGTSSSVNQ